MIKKYEMRDMSFTIGSFALAAMLYEVSSYPSPGLVSPVSHGAHKDMDYYTFIDSASVLQKYLLLCTESGFSEKNEKSIFADIREIGVQGEKDMFSRTHGVNTHKGMLFLMGISCAAAAKAIYDGKNFCQIKSIIKKMTEGISRRELGNIENKVCTHGEKIYKLYGSKGIRGEVEKGLPIVFDGALGFYRNNSDLHKRERLVQTLIYIMQYCDDSTILYRHSMEVLEEVRYKASIILKSGGMRTEAGRHAIEKMDSEFSAAGISPGGSADLLAATVFFNDVEKYMNNIYKK